MGTVSSTTLPKSNDPNDHSNENYPRMTRLQKAAIGLIVIYLLIILALLIGMFVYVVQVKQDSSKAVISSAQAAAASQEAATELKKLNEGFTKAGQELKALLDAVIKALHP